MYHVKNLYSHLLSLIHRHQNCRRAIQQIHSHFLHCSQYCNAIALWNLILKHYSLGAFSQDAIFLFKHFKNKAYPMTLDSFTYAYLIKACANLKQSNLGNQLYCLSSKVGFSHHVHVQTALVNMYLESGSLDEAKKVFDAMPEKNLVTWNVLITGYIKWGWIESARALFDMMVEKNVVTWTGIIDGYTRVNQYEEALSLFRRMIHLERIKPTEVTLLSIFPAIWNTGCLECCQMIHAYGEKTGINALDIRVMNCLIDAYAKCGSIGNAQQVFECIDDARKNLVSWTSIISAFAVHGMAVEVSEYFRQMENKHVKPNHITFLSVINACSHGGLVNEGIEFYRKMVEDFEMTPYIKHYGVLVDMLGRAGRLEEAEKIASDIPSEIENVVVWRTLLGACSFHGNVEMAERVTIKIMDLEREHSGDYVLLSNIFSGAGRFIDSERVRSSMDKQIASKVPGFTLIRKRGLPAMPPPVMAPPPIYAAPPPQKETGFIEGCLAGLCCCCLIDECC